MADADEMLTPADPADLAERHRLRRAAQGRRRIYRADEYMAKLAVERIVQDLELPRFVVVRRPPIGGSAPTRPEGR